MVNLAASAWLEARTEANKKSFISLFMVEQFPPVVCEGNGSAGTAPEKKKAARKAAFFN
jgi:hypothetical protein